jgi:hypothetical protein
MKKITLLLALAISFCVSAQQTISFESDGGYTLGDINGQNGWTSTGFTDADGNPANIDSQVISDEESTDGTASFKIINDGLFGGQANPVVGGFYAYPAPVPFADAVFSADLYLDTFDSTNTSDYLLGFTNTTVGSFVFYVRFTFDGNITVLAQDAAGTVVIDDTMTDWTPLTWFNIRMELDNNALEVFIDDVSIYTGFVATFDLDIESARFVSDNFAGFGYIDNFKTNDENLSNDTFVADNDFVHFVNNNLLNLQSSTILNNVEIYGLDGKRVLQNELNGQNDAQIDINSLNQGIYIARLNTENGVHSFKFAK